MSDDDRPTTHLIEPDPDRGTVIIVDLRKFKMLTINETDESVEIHILPKG